MILFKNSVTNNQLTSCIGGAEFYTRFEQEKLSSATAEFWDLGFWWIHDKDNPEIWDNDVFSRIIPRS